MRKKDETEKRDALREWRGSILSSLSLFFFFRLLSLLDHFLLLLLLSFPSPPFPAFFSFFSSSSSLLIHSPFSSLLQSRVPITANKPWPQSELYFFLIFSLTCSSRGLFVLSFISPCSVTPSPQRERERGRDEFLSSVSICSSLFSSDLVYLFASCALCRVSVVLRLVSIRDRMGHL